MIFCLSFISLKLISQSIPDTFRIISCKGSCRNGGRDWYSAQNDQTHCANFANRVTLIYKGPVGRIKWTLFKEYGNGCLPRSPP